jgi:catechol 2,3-dioxygenase-like lactoylglutathione lyase family enzyme
MPTPLQNTSSPFASWQVDHACLRVPEFDSAIAWYTEKLDFRLIRSLPLRDLTYAFLSPATDDSFSFELVAGPGADNRPPYEDLRSSLTLSGWHHIGFRVANVDRAIDELKRRGVTIVSEPHDVAPMGLRLAFFADPWGNLFEVIQSINPVDQDQAAQEQGAQGQGPQERGGKL